MEIKQKVSKIEIKPFLNQEEPKAKGIISNIEYISIKDLIGYKGLCGKHVLG